MNVLLTAIAQPSGMSGVQRHAFNVARSLLQRSEVDAVHFVLAPWQAHLPHALGFSPSERFRVEIAKVSRSSLGRNKWHYRDLPSLAKKAAADLVHLSYPVPFSRAAMPCPVAVTLHDLYPYEVPGNFGFPQVLVNRLILQQCLRGADAIACVSEATLSQLKRVGPSSAVSRALVVPNCVEPLTDAPCVPPITGWEGEPFLLCIAQHRRNKNLAFLLDTFHQMQDGGHLPAATCLVIVGIEGPETTRLHRLVERHNLGFHVLFLQGLSDAELLWCLRHCAALIAPSTAEGFGLPVAEGRLAGCRIVCSDIPAFRELAAPGCRLVPLTRLSISHFAEAISKALREPKPAPESLQHLGSEAVGARLLDLYAPLVQRAPRSAPSPIYESIPAQAIARSTS